MLNEWKWTCFQVERGTTLNSPLNVDLSSLELGISSEDCTDHTKENQVSTPRKSPRASVVRARVFSHMNNQEQRSFLAQRFKVMDVQELVNIFKAVYGRPADKGRPRSEPTPGS